MGQQVSPVKQMAIGPQNLNVNCVRSVLIILLLLFYTSLFHFYLISACRKLKKPANGATGSYLDSRAPVNATSTFNCSKGYTLIGEVMVTCQANGNWSNKEPECKRKKYWNLLANEHVIVPLFLAFSFSTFSCDDGYALNGATMVTCQANGNWSNKEPECKRKKYWNLLANEHVIVPLFLAFSLP